MELALLTSSHRSHSKASAVPRIGKVVKTQTQAPCVQGRHRAYETIVAEQLVGIEAIAVKMWAIGK